IVASRAKFAAGRSGTGVSPVCPSKVPTRQNRKHTGARATTLVAAPAHAALYRCCVSGSPGRGGGLSFGVIQSLLGNAPELLDSFVKGSSRLSPLGNGDLIAARPPQLLDGLYAPKGARPRSADGLVAHKHIDGIGV